MIELKVNPVFRDKIPPLTADEFRQLEENILADGIVREPLVVWNGTIVDGHHRWQIIQKHKELPFTVKEMDFADEWAAISWMCANQLGRRNITDEQKTYLLGKLYEARKNTKGGDRGTAKDETGKFTAKGQNGPLPFNSTAQRIANEQGVGENTVKRAEHFSKGLDAAEEVSEGFEKSRDQNGLLNPQRIYEQIAKEQSKVLSGEIAKTIRGAGAAALVPHFVICLYCRATRRVCAFSVEVMKYIPTAAKRRTGHYSAICGVYCSFTFVVLFDLIVNRPIDKPIDALASALCVGFDDLFFALWNNDAETVIIVFNVLVHGTLI